MLERDKIEYIGDVKMDKGIISEKIQHKQLMGSA
jgi:hypothetical protein